MGGGAVVVVVDVVDVVEVVVDDVVVGRTRSVVVDASVLGGASATSLVSPASAPQAVPQSSSAAQAPTRARRMMFLPLGPPRPEPARGYRFLSAGATVRRRRGRRQTEGVGSMVVRELGADEIGVRVRYFHEASDEQLALMGADRARFPPPDTWIATYVADMARPIEERQMCTLGWELDGEVVGFASLDRITFGDEGRFHLHILEPERRHRGLGVPFVRLSAARFAEMFALRRIVSEPNAFNVAPNRTLQRAGFRYDRTEVTTPGPINVEQPVTRWVLEAGPA